MTPNAGLPIEMLWQADGHASELALSALADRQDELVAPPVIEHVDSCLLCSERLYHTSQMTFSVGDCLARMSEHSPALVGQPAFARFPLPTVVLGLLVAAAGTLVWGYAAAEFLPPLLHALHLVPLFLWSLFRALPLVVDQTAHAFGAASLLAGGVLGGAGWLLARKFPFDLKKGPAS